VGKTFTINEFGRRSFENTVLVNFEQEPHYKACFDGLNPSQIIASLSVLTRQDLIPGRTLLFLDEIQECPQAITALRYFYEQMPQLHVIGAGSLLEFTLAEKNLKMPVGRVQYLYMKPLSFSEFLEALGEQKARHLLATSTSPIAPAVDDHPNTLIKKYLFLGGMPAVVDEYLASGDLQKCRRLQTAILQTYRDDFGKYANRVKHKYLEKVFYAVPAMVAQKFKYAQVDASFKSRDLKEALELLEHAGVVYRVKQTSGAGLPLEAQAKERHFKTVFLDTGLMQNICSVSEALLMSDDIMQVNAGAVAEHFVAQELLAYQDPYQPGALYYWTREARNSNAEVDYLYAAGHRVLPLEVKAGKTGTLRSMHLFLEQYAAPGGVRISSRRQEYMPPLLSVPFYAIEHLPKLIAEAYLP
jgi:predicted AAA+ superfamily ATPase